ncbi:chemotaxis protein CheA [Exilibacterium tricleocarpae]|uniref:Chemotaxis protein CheA n=1 Tax=Exilibacterium tricleocarpae TaxID=2591008 RepID=A0A545U408_9GAMM|nr:chemotaxis protein CheA [Exilibacterium tricleocarpae]TQV84174.1 chemotaxis protein CheA [Exilibacterium tricleocarpae]
MSIDLSQFHQVFFEESFEGLEEMESCLMELDPSAVDGEVINSIFRAAHSIKGGSATFGFDVVADFTHVLETLLDEIRAETRGISQDDVDLFLRAVDCLRELLSQLQQGEQPDTEVAQELKAAFEKILREGGDTTTAVATEPEPDAGETGTQSWKIYFRPGTDTLRTGNEPARMLRELAALGQAQVTVAAEEVPGLGALEPESCYLGWHISLTGSIEKAQIEEVFEWVVDESEIRIEAQAAPASATWSIAYRPGTDVLRTGNEPARMFRELAALGDLTVSADTDGLPQFSQLDPESSYLGWQLTLTTEADKSSIDEIFEWVIDESDLTIETGAEPVSAASTTVAPESEPAAAPAAPAPVPTSTPTAAKPAKSPPQAKPSGGDGAKKAVETSSIRVGIDKIDNLINMVGELVITQSMLGQLGTDFDLDRLPNLLEGLSQLEHNTRELQESVMRIRMLPISFAFSRFPRMVRDLSRRLNKKMEIELKGEQTELDKTVMEKIGDPLVHLVRNAVDHGIEPPEKRLAAGKQEEGKITLNAYHQGGNVVIEIIDDGRGLDRDSILAKAVEKELVTERDAGQLSDEQVYDLIFHPGFSTAKEVSDVSGRGVGMDVVKRNILALNGSVEITSTAGQGSKITIRLPLTLAILDGQLVRVGSHTYIFPLVSIIESLQCDSSLVNQVAGGCDVFQLRNEYVPIIRLFDVFSIEPDSRNLGESLMVVVECDGEKVGVVIDDLMAQQQVVIKSLEQNYQKVEGISGATILGDGTVALILDIPGIVKIAGVRHLTDNQVTSLARSHSNSELMALSASA